MDRLDLDILAILDDDGRQSYTAIARDLGVATATVHQRVKRLVDRGAIRRFSIDIDWEQAGLPVSAVVSIRTPAGRPLADVAGDLAALPFVVSCAAVTGEFDLFAVVRAESPDHLGTILEDIRRVADGPTRTVIVLAPYFVDRTPPLPDPG